MRGQFLLVVWMVLLQGAIGQEITQAEIDFTESLNQANLPLLQKIQKESFVDYSFQLVPDEKWHQFPELDIKINLKYKQFVKIDMNINVLASSGTGYIDSKLWIDGKENIKFRGRSAHFWWPAIFRTGQVFLEAGQHRIWVQYKHGYGTVTNEAAWDFVSNYLVVTYHCLASNN